MTRRPGRPPAQNTPRLQRRQRAGLTQADLARLAGRSPARVRAWERGLDTDAAAFVAVLARVETAPLFPEIE